MTERTPTKWQKRYAELRADGRCVTCMGKILPEWPQTTRCPECTEQRRPAIHRYCHSEKGKANKRRYRAREDVKARTREHLKERARQRKVAGLCKDCVLPCLEDSIYCAKHREVHRKATRDYERRKRAAKARGTVLRLKPSGPRKKTKGVRLTTRLIGRPYEPPPPKPETVFDRVVRAGSRFDSFRNEDIREAVGISTNYTSVVLARLVKQGRIERIRGGHGDVGSTYVVVQRRAA